MVFKCQEAFSLGQKDLEAFKKGMDRRFMKMYCAGLTEIIDFKFSGQERLVLDILVESLDYDNRICTTRLAIAERMGIPVSNVPRLLKALRKSWVIYPTPKTGQDPFGYVINPRYFWYGAEDDAYIDNKRLKRMQWLDGIYVVPLINCHDA